MRNPLLPALALVAAFAVPLVANANTLTIQCGSNAPIPVADGSPDDQSGPANSIAYVFTCDDIVDPAGNTWSASGTIRAIYTPGAGATATIDIFNARWISEGPNTVHDHFIVTHDFPVIGGAKTRASMNGDIVHPGAGIVDNVLLTVPIKIIKAVVGGTLSVGSLGAAGALADPVPFSDSFPFKAHVDPVGQIADFDFYLGVANDAFQFMGSQRFSVVTKQ